jgi:hypothetical protein
LGPEDFDPQVIFSSVSEPCPKHPLDLDAPVSFTASFQEVITKRPSEPVPRNKTEAMRSLYWPEYFSAEKEEMDVHRENGTWEYVLKSSLPKGTKILRLGIFSGRILITLILSPRLCEPRHSAF